MTCSIRRNKDSFIGPQEFVVGYSKAPEQPQSSARPIDMSFSHYDEHGAQTSEPVTIRIAAYRSSTTGICCNIPILILPYLDYKYIMQILLYSPDNSMPPLTPAVDTPDYKWDSDSTPTPKHDSATPAFAHKCMILVRNLTCITDGSLDRSVFQSIFSQVNGSTGARLHSVEWKIY